MASYDSRVKKVYDKLRPWSISVELNVLEVLEWLDEGLVIVPTSQRLLDKERVQELKDEQLKIVEVMHERQRSDFTILMVGCLVMVEKANRFELVDGQHRMEMVRQFKQEGRQEWLDGVKVVVNYHYDCDDLCKYSFIYKQCGNTYEHAGIVPEAAQIQAGVNHLKDAAEKIGERFAAQKGPKGAKRPRFHPNRLYEKLQEVSIIKDWTSEKIVAKILQANQDYEAGLDNNFYGVIKAISTSEKTKYKAGFFLPHMEADCRWVNKIRWDTPEQQG